MAKKIDPEKEAIDRLKEAAFHPSLDALWAKHPDQHTPEEREALVAALRTERAMWRAQEARRERKKAGGNGQAPEALLDDASQEVWE